MVAYIHDQEFTRDQFAAFLKQQSLAGRSVLAKFSAGWCGPCQRIKPVVDECLRTLNDDDRVVVVEINVDDSFDLFAGLKSKKIVPAIPAFLYYQSASSEDIFAPDDILIGADPVQVRGFFEKIAQTKRPPKSLLS
jgi:thiol-disulfide isomerase/thioredoxin